MTLAPERHEGCAEVNGIRMNYVREGSGPLIMLIHGFPETSFAWRYVIPALSKRFTVVAPDMRGYGLSDKPLDGYDKRTMAADMRQLAGRLGFDKIKLMVGHDRGARVAHRCGLDFPEVVERLAMLDLVPTREAMRTLDFNDAKRYWHWFFHLVPDVPEVLIGANIEAYINMYFKNAYIRPAVDEALPVYVKSLGRVGALRSALADYRATFTADAAHDDASAAAGDKLRMPTLLLWGDKGLTADREKMLEIWRNYAVNVAAASVPECGYYMAEEQPLALAKHLLEFIASNS